jgi:WS/DGAT/MGAT family acyltransferase
MRRMSGLDAMFLYNEIPTQHMHTLKVAILEPEDPANYAFEAERRKLAQGLGRLRPFRWRVVPTPFHLNHPLWIEDPDFDLDLHVKRAALPAPGGREELADFISEIASTPLDRTRPMWKLWLVEGLEDGRIATVAKVHHSLADGHASAELLTSFASTRPGEPSEAAIGGDSWQPEPVPSKTWLLWRGFVDLLAFLKDGVPRYTRAFAAARRRKAAREREGGERSPAPFSGPDTVFNGVLSSHRRFAYMTLSLPDAKLVRKAFGGTLNDVILAVVSGALRRYLAERDQLPEPPLVAWIPMDTRAPDDEPGFGNHSAVMYENLCTDIEDPVERLLAIQRCSAISKRDFADTEGARQSDFFKFVPPVVSALLMSRVSTFLKKRGRPSQANLIISNVKGPTTRLFADRTPLQALYSIGPVLEGVGLNITAWSYGDQLNFSLLSDRKMLPDLWPLADGLRDSLAELTKLATERASAESTDESPGESP